MLPLKTKRKGNQMTEIIVAIIGAIATIMTTLISSKKQKSLSERYDAKNSIMMMTHEDPLLVQEGHLPVNYQNILHEFDLYRKNGGNSYMEEKVEAYKKWYKEVETKLHPAES